MRPLIRKLQPTSGIAHFLHLVLVLILPAAAFVLVRLNLTQLALLLIILSKWRMFAVRPRFWPANVRANGVDLMIGLSAVTFMSQTNSLLMQVLWAVLYVIWLLFIKPGTTIPMIALQAFLGQFAALMALFLVWDDGPTAGITLLTGLFCFLAARHYFDTFDEPYAKMLAYIWGYFGAALAWLSGHWLLFYHGLSQPALMLSVLGYGLAVLYYLDHNDRLSKTAQRQFIFIMVAIIIVVLAFSDWGDKVV